MSDIWTFTEHPHKPKYEPPLFQLNWKFIGAVVASLGCWVLGMEGWFLIRPAIAQFVGKIFGGK